MTTILKSRRSGEDLRDHPDAPPVNPAPTDAQKCTVEIRSHNPGQFDRGNYLVLVDDVLWGRIHTTWHGMHGTTYHLADLHGAVGHHEESKFRSAGGGRFVEVQARIPNKRQWYSEHNIGKPQDQHVARPTAEQVQVTMVREAIAAGYFRHPHVRAAEISDANAKREQLNRQVEAEKDADWNARIDVVLDKGEYLGTCERPGIHFENVDALKAAIRDAMKWAQSK